MNGKPLTHGEKIVELQTDNKNTKQDIKEINESLKTITTAVAPIEELSRILKEDHKKMNRIEPLVENNEEFIKKLKKHNCPEDKVANEDLEKRDKNEKTARNRFITILVALLGIAVTLYTKLN